MSRIRLLFSANPCGEIPGDDPGRRDEWTASPTLGRTMNGKLGIAYGPTKSGISRSLASRPPYRSRAEEGGAALAALVRRLLGARPAAGQVFEHVIGRGPVQGVVLQVVGVAAAGALDGHRAVVDAR